MTDSTGSKTFKRNGVDVTAPLLSDGTATFTPSGEVRGGVKTTYHSALKNPDIQTSSTQVKTASKVYDAFGNLRTGSGSWKGQFQYGGKFGYQQDTDSGLKLLGHRFYDSTTGRFLTRDPVRSGSNWYTYCENNPINGVDPLGYEKITVLYKLVSRETDEILKWGITKNPKSRYRQWWLRLNNIRMDEIAHYETRAEALRDERVLESEMPGPMNRTPWAKKAKELGYAATTAAVPAGLTDYEKEMEKNRLDFTPLTFIPNIVGDVIAGAQELGNAINRWGAEWRKARYDYAEVMVSDE